MPFPSSPTAVSARLAELGLSPAAIAPKVALFSQCSSLLDDLRPTTRERTAFYVPGRIEVLGKHTDYGGGRSLLVAVERGFCAVIAPRTDSTVRIRPAQFGEPAKFPLDASLQPVAGQWSNYAMTSARRIARNFGSTGPALRGADIVFASDLPPAAGMSSSSALLTLIFLILSKVNHLSERPEYRREVTSLESLAGYLGTVENGQSFGSLSGDRGVGTFGGSQDHTAILCCMPHQFSQYSFCPVEFQRRVSLPAGWVLAIASSGVSAEKTGGAREGYNRMSRVMSTIVSTLNAHDKANHPHLAAILRAHPNDTDSLRSTLLRSTGLEFPGDILAARFDQFYEESEQIIPAVAEALARSDASPLGALVDRSQSLSQTALANLTPETIFLPQAARDLGAAAASAFGAGFGGSVWALVRTPADDFLRDWRSRYTARFPDRAAASTFFPTEPGPAAAEL